MNIQDIQYITEIAESGSIGKAASKLLVAQPSLSKCIRKIENEYGITLFTRVKGVSVRLTPEGELFLGMAREILLSHSRFQEQLRRHQELQKNTIVLGLTYQRTVDLAGPVLEAFYRNVPQQVLQIETRSTAQLQQGLLDNTLDAALFIVSERYKELFYEPVMESCLGIYLREGSPAAAKAEHIDGIPYPVLRIEDIAEERFTVNSPGSASRYIVDEVLRKNNISAEIMDVTNNQSRMAIVNSGIASSFVPLFSSQRKVKNESQLFAIHPDQNITYQVCLVCRNGFQNSSGFRMITKVIKQLV